MDRYIARYKYEKGATICGDYWSKASWKGWEIALSCTNLHLPRYGLALTVKHFSLPEPYLLSAWVECAAKGKFTRCN